MAIWLNQTSDDFELRFAAFLTTKREISEDVNNVVGALSAGWAPRRAGGRAANWTTCVRLP